MSLRFITLDADDIESYEHLETNDSIVYLQEYSSGSSFHTEGNSLIYNLKKSPDTKGTMQWGYKEQAMTRVARFISSAMDNLATDEKTVYWIPVPPSKIDTHEQFDDRMNQILIKAKKLSNNPHNIIANNIYQTRNREASSTTNKSRGVEALKALEDQYEMRDILGYDAESDLIVIFDDVLTSGCHFRAVKNVVLKSYPNAEIGGIFVARTVKAQQDCNPEF